MTTQEYEEMRDKLNLAWEYQNEIRIAKSELEMIDKAGWDVLKYVVTYPNKVKELLTDSDMDAIKDMIVTAINKKIQLNEFYFSNL